MGALISDCGAYRYWLSRPKEIKHPDRCAALFVMLNPSTAGASEDDPTVRRCRGFARRWGCNGVVVGNLYALRSTNPKALWTASDPVGPDNDIWLLRLARDHGNVVCAWGASAKPGRVSAVVKSMRGAGARLFCLGQTKNGSPRHPLYVRSDQQLIPFDPDSNPLIQSNDEIAAEALMLGYVNPRRT